MARPAACGARPVLGADRPHARRLAPACCQGTACQASGPGLTPAGAAPASPAPRQPCQPPMPHLEVCPDGPLRVHPLQALELARAGVQAAVVVQQVDARQVGRLADLKVGRVVPWRDLEHAGAKVALHALAGDDGDLPARRRRPCLLPAAGRARTRACRAACSVIPSPLQEDSWQRQCATCTCPGAAQGDAVPVLQRRAAHQAGPQCRQRPCSRRTSQAMASRLHISGTALRLMLTDADLPSGVRTCRLTVARCTGGR